MRTHFVVILVHLIQISIASLHNSENNSKTYKKLIENGILKEVGEYVVHTNQYNVSHSQCYRDIDIWMKAFPFEMWALKSELFYYWLFTLKQLVQLKNIEKNRYIPYFVKKYLEFQCWIQVGKFPLVL